MRDWRCLERDILFQDFELLSGIAFFSPHSAVQSIHITMGGESHSRQSSAGIDSFPLRDYDIHMASNG